MAADDERKITVHEKKVSGSDGHAEVLNAGGINFSVREFDELGGGAFKKGAADILCACCTTSNATSFGVSHEGEETALRERRGTKARQRCWGGLEDELDEVWLGAQRQEDVG